MERDWGRKECVAFSDLGDSFREIDAVMLEKEGGEEEVVGIEEKKITTKTRTA